MFGSVPASERLFLFDIDGTLLSAGGAPRRAFRQALLDHFGTEGDAANNDFSGKTDPQIVYELMRAAGFTDGHIGDRLQGLFDDYLAGLAIELETETRHYLFPGVAQLIPALATALTPVLGTRVFMLMSLLLGLMYGAFVVIRMFSRDPTPPEDAGHYQQVSAQVPLTTELGVPASEDGPG